MAQAKKLFALTVALCFCGLALFVLLIRTTRHLLKDVFVDYVDLSAADYAHEEDEEPLCPLHRNKVQRAFFNDKITNVSLGEVESILKSSKIRRGEWRPPEECVTRIANLLVIIPLSRESDSEVLLTPLLLKLHPTLQYHNHHYRMVLVKLANSSHTINIGKLLNAAFSEALKRFKYIDCVVFHDVHVIPTNPLLNYSCSDLGPVHLSSVVRGVRNSRFGGVLALTTEQFQRLNGFSNEFWGMRGGNAALWERLLLNSRQEIVTPANLGTFKLSGDENAANDYLLASDSETVEQNRHYISKFSGLSSLEFRLVETVEHSLYTEYRVDLFEQKSKQTATKPQRQSWLIQEKL